MTTENNVLETIALNAIRWRAKDDNDGKAMAQKDRRWLLRYIDSQRRATVERIREAALAKRKQWGAEGLPASLESILNEEAAR